MIDILIAVPALVLLLGTLVLFHEFGHFTAAKLLKIRVEEFAFGFGPKWLRLFKLGDTEYTIHPVPLGGFVKLAGAEPGEEATPGSFNSKPWYKRWLVFIAGPFMSFMLAYIIFCAMGFTVGLPIEKNGTLNKVDVVRPGSEAMRAGLRSGDVIESINGVRIDSGQKMLDMVNANPNKKLAIVLDREGKSVSLNATPKPDRFEFGWYGFSVDIYRELEALNNQVSDVVAKKPARRAGLKPGDTIKAVNSVPVKHGPEIWREVRKNAGSELALSVERGRKTVTIKLPAEPEGQSRDRLVGLLGFAPKQKLTRTSLVDSVKYGNEHTIRFIKFTFLVLFSPIVKEAAGGPLSIASQTLISVKRGPYGFLELLGTLSLSLGIVNLLPIPPMDGGHMLLLVGEGIKRKRLSTRTIEWASGIGLAIIAIIFVLIMYLDLTRLVQGRLFR